MKRLITKNTRLTVLISAVMSAQISVAAPISETQLLTKNPLADETASSIYLDRKGEFLHQWRMGAEGELLFYLGSQELITDPAIGNPIEIPEHVSAVYYSDDIWDDEIYPISMVSNQENLKAILPRDAELFEPLYQHLDIDNEHIITDPQLSELHDGHITVLKLVAESEQTQRETLLSYLNNMAKIVAQQFTENKALHEEFIQQIEQARLDAESLVDSFEQQASQDKNTLSTVVAQVEAIRDKLIKQDRQAVLNCVDNLKRSVKEQQQRLKSMLGRIKDEEQCDGEDNDCDGIIDEAEARIDRQHQQILACQEGLASQGQHPPELDLDLMQPYLDIEQQALILQEQNELWALNAEQTWLERGEQLEQQLSQLPEIEVLYQIRQQFKPWMSKKFWQMSENASASSSLPTPTTFKQSIVSKQPKAIVKSDEKLCENQQSFYLEFDLGFAALVIGTPWNDVIKTGNNHDLIFSFSGDDCIESHAGYDLVLSGPGRDQVFAGDDHDFVFAGRDDDEVHGSAGNSYTIPIGPIVLDVDLGNLILGQAGNDKLYGGEVNRDKGENGTVEADGFTDLIFGDGLNFGHPPGKDLIHGEKGQNFLFGSKEDDTIQSLEPGSIDLDGIPIPVGSFFFGGDDNDTLTGSDTPFFVTFGDFMFGNKGNDTAFGRKGNDMIFGGKGEDTLNGDKGHDLIFGYQDNDMLSGNDGTDLLFAGVGDDTILAGKGVIDLSFGYRGHDTIEGEDGLDLIFAGRDNDNVQGGDGPDLIFGSKGQDNLNGNDSLDLIFGGKGEDQINGGNSVDLLFGNDESDIIHGNDGFDVIFGNENSRQKPEQLFGDNSLDLMFGNGGEDHMSGGNGPDVMFGNGSADIMHGNDSVDLMWGNDGQDRMFGDQGLDFMWGGENQDHMWGGTQTDLISGGNGSDCVYGEAGIDVLFGGEHRDMIAGGDQADLMFGGNETDEMFGLAGLDMVFGGAGNDYLNGGNTGDLLFGGDGNDHLRGEQGTDFVFGQNGNDYLNGGANGDFAFASDGNDTVNGADGNDFIFAGEGNDRAKADNGNDFIFGNKGNDQLRGVQGRNFVFGNKDSDTLDGYDTSTPDPRDFLFGNSGSDTLTGNKNNQRDIRAGGSGSDTKHWNQIHVADTGFSPGWTFVTTCD